MEGIEFLGYESRDGVTFAKFKFIAQELEYQLGTGIRGIIPQYLIANYQSLVDRQHNLSRDGYANEVTTLALLNWPHEHNIQDDKSMTLNELISWANGFK